MKTAVVHVRPTSRALGRVAALLALGSAVVHLMMLDDSLAAVVMVGMAATCLPCAWHLWRSPAGSVWRLTALLDVAMLALHVQMVGGSADQMRGMSGMDHPSGSSAVMWVGIALIAGQLALATTVAVSGVIERRHASQALHSADGHPPQS